MHKGSIFRPKIIDTLKNYNGAQFYKDVIAGIIVGFTTGIAVIIFSSQMKDFFGFKMGNVPADFINKWIAYSHNIASINVYALAIGAVTLVIILFWPKVTHKIPGSLIAILATTL